MNLSNEPVPQPETKPQPKNSRNPIIAALTVAVVALGGYLIYDKTNNSEKIREQQSEISAVSVEKSNVQTSFDASLSRLDSMAGVNNTLNSSVVEKNKEIAQVKEEIRGLLNKQNASAEEIARAKTLINKLNGKISNLQAEVARLKEDNQLLTRNLEESNVARQDLEKKVDIGSTLNASNIQIIPINVKGNGREKESTNAHKVDKLLVSFDVSNRIAQPGNTDLYVIVSGPDGQPIATSGGATGSFTTREEGDKTFTAKVPVELQMSKGQKVTFSFVPAGTFKKGNYHIEIYQNGFMIGEGTRSLKGGLFG
ncbi:MAG: hypothetical protein JWQ27_1573 [Ferruginibacter sp.]|nr:hypothetical protein [Ferruginibacter sp.]